METTNVDSFEATGFLVRTKNAHEMNPSTAKIGPLWEQFFLRPRQSLLSILRFSAYTLIMNLMIRVRSMSSPALIHCRPHH